MNPYPDSPIIDVVVVTYNSGACIKECLEELAKAGDGCRLRVTLVDNASTDNTLEVVMQVQDDVRVIRCEDNGGYAQANNIAIKSLLSEKAETILVLNPDITLKTGVVRGLYDLLYSSPMIGGVSPFLIEHIQSPGSPLELKSLWRGKLKRTNIDGCEVVESDRLLGACMLIKREVFERIGMFDEEYFLYWEEVDFCYKMSRAGFTQLIWMNVEIPHRLGNAERPHRIFYLWRNQFRFAFRTFSPFKAILFLMRRSVGNAREALVYLKTKRFDLIHAGLSGWMAGILGERGKSCSPYALPSTGKLKEFRNDW